MPPLWDAGLLWVSGSGMLRCFQPLLLPPGTGGSPAWRHTHPKGALNISLCFSVASIPIFQSFPTLGSAGTGERLWGSQCPLQRQHPTKKWVFPAFPTPCLADGLGVSAHPPGPGGPGWLPSPAPRITLDSAPGTARRQAGLLGRRAGLFTIRAAIRSAKGEAKHMVSNVPDPLFQRPGITRPRLLDCSGGGTGSAESSPEPPSCEALGCPCC